MALAKAHKCTVVGDTADLQKLDKIFIAHKDDATSPFCYLSWRPTENDRTLPDHRRFSLEFDNRYNPVGEFWNAIEDACPSLVAHVSIWSEADAEDENPNYAYFAISGNETKYAAAGTWPEDLDRRLIPVVEYYRNQRLISEAS
jgi:hypothetical protein